MLHVCVPAAWPQLLSSPFRVRKLHLTCHAHAVLGLRSCRCQRQFRRWPQQGLKDCPQQASKLGACANAHAALMHVLMHALIRMRTRKINDGDNK